MTIDLPQLRAPRLLEAALNYAALLGVPVFPVYGIAGGGCDCGNVACHSPGKHPHTGRGLLEASTDEAQIREWWRRWPGANIGMPTGAASMLWALDVDLPAGEESLSKLIEQHGALPIAPIARTGSGGRQVFFAYSLEPEIRNSVSKIGPNLDIRGEGGYVVLPPSLHITGRRYAWLKEARIEEIELVKAPEWLINLCVNRSAARANNNGPSTADTTGEAIPEGQRNDALYRLARSLRSKGLSDPAVLAAVAAENHQKCRPPLADGEIAAIVDHAFRQSNTVQFEQQHDARFCGFSTIEPVRDRLMQLDAALANDISQAFDSEFLDAAAALEHYDAGEFARLTIRLKSKGLGVGRWERAVRDRARKERERFAELAKEQKAAAKTATAAEPQWAPAAKVCDTPVDGKALLSDLTTAVRRFVMLDETAALVVALWVLFTWLFEHGAETNPYLRIISPTPECGKSTLLKVIKFLARGGWLVSRITASAFTRTMQRERRSLLLDEGDSFLHENQVMRNVLDAANDPDTANVSMSVKSGDDWVPAEFNVFVPIVIASIGALRKMQTVESRSIPVRLKRATRNELKQLLKGRRRELTALLEPLAAQCARWAADSADKLKGARPNLPDALSGREQDMWEPLVAIADAISPEVGMLARAAATMKHKDRDDDSPFGVLLLADIRSIFDEKEGRPDADKITSKEACEALVKLEGRSWSEYGKARKPVTQNQLARLLKPFVIVPRKVRLSDGSTPNGYQRKDFEDAWERYPAAPSDDPGGEPSNTDSREFDDPKWHNGTTLGAVGESRDFQGGTEAPCSTSENGTFPYGENECAGVPLRNGDLGLEQENIGPKDPQPRVCQHCLYRNHDPERLFCSHCGRGLQPTDDSGGGPGLTHPQFDDEPEKTDDGEILT